MTKNSHVSHDQLVADIEAGTIDTVLAVFGDHAGPHGRQAHRRRVLPRRRARRGHRELRLPDRLRPRQQPDPRVPLGELRPGLRRHARRRRRGDGALPPVDRPRRRWCCVDLVDVDTGAPVEVSPRRMLQRQVEQAPRPGLRADDRLGDRVLPLQGGVRRGQRARLPRPHAELAVRRGLPHPADDARRRTCSARSGAASPAPGMPVEFSKGEAGKGQHELNLTYQTAVEMADINLRVQERRQGDRPPVRQVGHVHGQAVLRRRRVELPHPLQPVVAPTARR